METVDSMHRELIEFLMLLSSLSRGQIQGLCDFVNGSGGSAVELNPTALNGIVRDMSGEDLEKWIEQASSAYQLGEGSGGATWKGSDGNVLEKDSVMFVQLYHLYLLHKMLRDVTDVQLIRLFDVISPGAQIQQLQALQEIQQLLAQLNPETLASLHQELQTSDTEPLHNLLQLEPKDFYLYKPLRLLLALPLDELLQLKNVFPQWDFLQLLHLTKLYQIGTLEAMNLRMIIAPEKGEESEDMGEFEGLQVPLTLEIVEQPPGRCVYKRNVKPPPTVSIVGDQAHNDGNIFIVPVLLRCDTLEEVPKLIKGDNPVKITSSRTIIFKRLKILSTSHQLNETLFSLRFELRRYNPTNSKEFEIIHSVTTTPICVLSHSSQLKATSKTLPLVVEVIPYSGPPSGHTRVAILGSNFIDSPTTRVKFDNTEVMPFFHGAKTLICHAPRHSPGPVLVRVCNDPNRWSETAGTYTYNSEPTHEPPTHNITVPNLPNFPQSLTGSGGLSNLINGTLGVDPYSDLLNLTVLDDHGYSPLHYTTSYGNKDLTTYYLSRGGDPSFPDKNGNAPIHWATYYGHTEITMQLVEVAPKSINSINKYGNTPLHIAAKQGYLELVAELIQYGALINIQNDKGKTPLHMAIMGGHQEVVRYLISVGASVNTQSYKGTTPFQIAVITSQITLAKLLIQKAQVHLQSQDDSGDTALHWAVRSDNEEMVKLLLESGALPNIKNEEGETPLNLASELNHKNIIPLLVTFAMVKLSLSNSLSPKKFKNSAKKVSQSKSSHTVKPTYLLHLGPFEFENSLCMTGSLCAM